MNKFIKHLGTVNKHRWIVMKNCFHCGQYVRGLTHDLSKYSPIEFFSGVKYFQGNRSPIDAEKEENGFSLAWQHHKGHNPHHWEYWIDNVGTKENTPCKIPYKYVVEMICDWIGAGKVYEGKSWNQHSPKTYYQKVRDQRIIHPATNYLIDIFLNKIDEEGLKAFYKLSKQRFLKDEYELDFLFWEDMNENS